ncbi:hypothetical protein Emag_007781 [Eimeria magna]
MAEVARLNSATAENGWKGEAQEGVTYANMHKVMEHTELERRGPQADLDISLVVEAAGGRLAKRSRGADCRTQVAQAMPQKAHPPVRSMGHMVDCSAQGNAPQLGGAGGRRVRAAGVQNPAGGKLVQDERPLRGSWRKGCPRQTVDMLLLSALAVDDLEPELSQAQSPALEAPALRAIVADVL